MKSKWMSEIPSVGYVAIRYVRIRTYTYVYVLIRYVACLTDVNSRPDMAEANWVLSLNTVYFVIIHFIAQGWKWLRKNVGFQVFKNLKIFKSPKFSFKNILYTILFRSYLILYSNRDL